MLSYNLCLFLLLPGFLSRFLHLIHWINSHALIHVYQTWISTFTSPFKKLKLHTLWLVILTKFIDYSVPALFYFQTPKIYYSRIKNRRNLLVIYHVMQTILSVSLACFKHFFMWQQWMNRFVKNNRIFTAGIPPLLLPLAPRDFPVVVVSSSSSSSWYSISHLLYNEFVWSMASNTI